MFQFSLRRSMCCSTRLKDLVDLFECNGNPRNLVAHWKKIENHEAILEFNKNRIR
jgi:hypothetical protein